MEGNDNYEKEEELGFAEGITYDTKIDSYEIGEVLGEGGMGTVYKALYGMQRCQVAIKKVLIRKADSEAERPPPTQFFTVSLPHAHAPCLVGNCQSLTTNSLITNYALSITNY